MRIIERAGKYFTRSGVQLAPGARCPHLVVDGDKPLTASGPRCDTCRAGWNPVFRKVDRGRGLEENTYCPTCNEWLYVSHGSFAKTDSLGNSEQAYEPQCWTHSAPRSCPLNTFPVEGYEENYWVNWAWATAIDLRDHKRSKER